MPHSDLNGKVSANLV